MFGESISKEVISEHAEYTTELRKVGLLGINSIGALTSSFSNRAIPIRNNTFFGDIF